jgi:hypothetical protein
MFLRRGCLSGKNSDVFEVPPPRRVDVAPSLIDGEIRKSSSFDNINAPQLLDEAWMKYIIEFHLPQDLEQLIVAYLKPLIDLAPKSNIRRREITMHLIAYDLIWDSYFIYMRKGKYDPKLLVVKEILRNAIELQLNRSVDGWLGRLMHTKLFRIFTSDEQSRTQRGMRFLGGRKNNKGNNQEF